LEVEELNDLVAVQAFAPSLVERVAQLVAAGVDPGAKPPDGFVFELLQLPQIGRVARTASTRATACCDQRHRGNQPAAQASKNTHLDWFNRQKNRARAACLRMGFAVAESSAAHLTQRTHSEL
jgi:hypothetical protein